MANPRGRRGWRHLNGRLRGAIPLLLLKGTQDVCLETGELGLPRSASLASLASLGGLGLLDAL